MRPAEVPRQLEDLAQHRLAPAHVGERRPTNLIVTFSFRNRIDVRGRLGFFNGWLFISLTKLRAKCISLMD